MKTSAVLIGLSLLFFSSVKAQTPNGSISGAALFCDTINTGFISLSNYSGTIVKWQYNTAAKGWMDLNNITPTQYYFHLKQTTSYRAITQISNLDIDTSAVCTITVHVAGESAVVLGGGLFCEAAPAGTLSLSGYAGKLLAWQSSTDEATTWLALPDTDKTLQYASTKKSTWFRCILNTYAQCANDTTQPVVLKIDEASVAGNLKGSDSLCYKAANFSFSLSGSKGTILGWYESNNNLNWQQLPVYDTLLQCTHLKENKFYKVEVKNGSCPALQSNTAYAAIFPHIPTSAGTSQTITRYQSCTISGVGTGKANWWPTEGLSDATALTTLAMPHATTRYFLTTTDVNQCTDTASVLVIVQVPLPTAFSPNGDGVNDSFEIEDLADYQNCQLQVINRFGFVVYKEYPYNNGWRGQNLNGQALPDDVYYYTLSADDKSISVTNSVLIKR